MTERPTPDGSAVQCACCDAAASVRVRWFVTGPGWQEKDLCQSHAKQVHEATTGAVAGLYVPPVTYGVVGQPIFSPEVIASSRAAGRDDDAAMRGL
jgi:hypothetical protein